MEKTQPRSHRSKVRLNTGWTFSVEGATEEPKVVTIPHTLALTSLHLDHCPDGKMQETFHRRVSWYKKDLLIEGTPGRRAFLEFEGAQQVTDLWVNGSYAGRHDTGGYTPFHFDITDLVTWNETNGISIRLDNRVNKDIPPDPGPYDYVKFSGLYRDLYLVITDPLYITFPWESLDAGVRITTPCVKKTHGTFRVQTTVRNSSETSRNVTVESLVIDRDDVVVKRIETPASVGPGVVRTVSQTDGIDEDFHAWSCDAPYLYRVLTSIVDEGGHVLDMQEHPLGFRRFELRDGEGFFLNGEYLKLIGTNRHQHFAFMGDAVPSRCTAKTRNSSKTRGLTWFAWPLSAQ